MLTAERVQEALERESSVSMPWGSFEYHPNTVEAVRIDGVTYDFEIVASKFGEEGDWQCQTWIVFRLGDQHFKKFGHYASHDGEYWDGSIIEVEPQEQTVIIWRDK